MGTDFTKQWWCETFGITEQELIVEAGTIGDDCKRLFSDSNNNRKIKNSSLLRKMVGKQSDYFPMSGNVIHYFFNNRMEQSVFNEFFLGNGEIRNVPSFTTKQVDSSKPLYSTPYTISKVDFFAILQEKIRPWIDSGEVTKTVLEEQRKKNAALRGIDSGESIPTEDNLKDSELISITEAAGLMNVSADEFMKLIQLILFKKSDFVQWMKRIRVRNNVLSRNRQLDFNDED